MPDRRIPVFFYGLFMDLDELRSKGVHPTKKAPFVDRDLYVFCIGPNRAISAHGATASYVGSSADALKDADGKPLGKAILDAAAGKGGGSVRYRWLNPVSGTVEPKVSFVRKVGEDVCGVGAYQPE